MATRRHFILAAAAMGTLPLRLPAADRRPVVGVLGETSATADAGLMAAFRAGRATLASPSRRR
jgi:hypothetical protein